ncbi:ABC transporter substrate-binding protein [Haloplasma contractile]|uniref:Extracellular solute-binding protein family 1 n=1 Tax=Haloplasma contractile SSD-17B TaxID=1033810 RepID=U2FJV9_9MOLU|nr:sugar ABC transporter substrate-binding protein [Haloplasma contractile]ERJ13105.1 Extracellular solute-binding protein family 1 [Haloplasma contractile SSD-17B]
MKKLFALLILAVLTITLAACGEKEEKEKITIWAWDPNFNIAIMEEAKTRFLEENPDVEIEIVDYAKADLEQKLHTNLASGLTKGLPDIVLIEDYNSQKYLQSYPGSFADLTNEVDHSKFADYKVELMTVDNKVYGVPFDSGVSGFYYRTDILSEAGYTASDLENITWDRYIEIGKDVVEKTGKKMVAFDPNDGGVMRIMLQSAGDWYFDNEGNVAVKDSAVLKESLRLYKEMVDAGITKPTTGWGEWVGAMNNGDVASVVTGVWITGSIKSEDTQSGKWAVAPIPKLDMAGAVNASNLGGSSWYVLDSSDNKDLAIEFLNDTYSSDVDFYQTILTNRGAVGSYIPSQTGAAYTEEDEFFGNQKIYEDFATWMNEIPSVNYGLYTYEADAAIMAEMQDILNGNKTFDEALESAENTVKAQIEE